MPVSKIEALIDSIANLKGSTTNPESDLYQMRSPIGIMSFSLPGKNEIDDQGRRVFGSWMAGYRATEFDVKLKVAGESRAGLKKDDLLENLLRVYKIEHKLGQQQIVRFLRRALKDESISVTTPLSYFREETK